MTVPADNLEALIQAYWAEVFGMLLALTRRRAVAEELAQEVFLLALEKGLAPGPHLEHWFKSAAWRLAMNELRRKQPVTRDPSLIQESAAQPEPDDPAAEGASFNEELAALKRCLAGLGDDDRALLDARYKREAPLAKLAQTYGQSIGYLKQRLFRLRRRLAACIRKRVATGAAADA